MLAKVKDKRFLVTGGAGFVGSSMVERLVKEGAWVGVYDNLGSGRREFIKHFENGKKVKFFEADLLDMASLNKVLKSEEIDAIVHLAANPDVVRGIKETDLDLRQGTLATYNVVEAARKNDVGEILFSSSSVVYGIPTIRPTPEDYGPLKPISLYGASKLASEGLITAFSHLFGMNYYIYRFANVVGKNQTHGVILDFAKKLRKNSKELEVLGDGKQRKSYIDVEDCVDAMLFVYEKSKDAGNIYNIASDDQVSVKEIAELVVNKFSKDAVIRYTGTPQGWPGDIANTYLSNKKLSAFGWNSRYNSLEAVKRAVEMVYQSFGA